MERYTTGVRDMSMWPNGSKYEMDLETVIASKEKEIAILKTQIHDNTQFLQAIIMELIHKGTTATVARSPSVPLNSGANSTKSVKELNNEAKLAGPVKELPG